MSRARRLIRALFLLAGLLGWQSSGGARPVPAPSPVEPVRVAGPTPHCATAVVVKADGSTSTWDGVCKVGETVVTMPGEYPSREAARDAVFAFQQAWRDARR
jgi:hypothetical protein